MTVNRRPFKPPLAFSSLIAMRTPASVETPQVASEPVIEAKWPIGIGSVADWPFAARVSAGAVLADVVLSPGAGSWRHPLHRLNAAVMTRTIAGQAGTPRCMLFLLS